MRSSKPLARQLDELWDCVDNGGTGGGTVGPKGDKGDKGDPGEQGIPGNDGAPGDDGQAGPKGDTGDRGEQGIQGQTGNDGNDGADGAPGADGPSAYQVAVANGYIGNEAQWLVSLVGAKGDKGDQGNVGETGAQGIPGTNGSDGNDGAPGSDASVTNANVNTAITADRPATKTALGLVKADVGLGNVDNTADANKAVLSATKLATGRTISITGKGTAAGGSFDGSGNLAINITAVTLVAGDIPTIAQSQVTNLTSDLALKAPLASPTFTGTLGAAAIAATGAVTSTVSFGFASGAGGSQTQSPNKTSAVTLNKAHGLITMSNAALAAATIVSHTLTNSQIAATDQVICTHVSGGTSGAYTINAFPSNGSAVISVRNNTAGSLSEAIAYRFTVIKGQNA